MDEIWYIVKTVSVYTHLSIQTSTKHNNKFAFYLFSSQNRSDFEMVKRGTKTRDSGIEGPSSVNLENRYDSLRK